MTYLVNIADLRDPDDPQGRSYREINRAKQHTIPIGALVQLKSGTRLFVVYQGRDCDQTPLYWLSTDEGDTKQEREGRMNRGWSGGWPEDSLTVV
jgi:hypothetical protein